VGLQIRSVTASERELVRSTIIERWGDETVVGHGEVMRPHEHAGFVAVQAERWVGLATYRIVGDGCEVVSIDAFDEGRGVGSALLLAVVDAARAAGCARVWLTTTNDNIRALGFYRHRGFRVVRIHERAVDESRLRFKPSIPLVNADNGLPIRDEIELERTIEAPAPSP
jgi:ribosomal protein S18 acetylase RimI-like enzyme